MMCAGLDSLDTALVVISAISNVSVQLSIHGSTWTAERLESKINSGKTESLWTQYSVGLKLQKLWMDFNSMQCNNIAEY